MDFRSFLALLERSGELINISKPVKIEYEIGALCRELSDLGGPAAMLKDVIGASHVLAVNVYGTRRRVALAFGVTEDELLGFVAERLKSRISTKPFEGRPRCQDVVITGKDIDITRLPFPLWNIGDGGRFSTAGMVIASHPEFGLNIAYHRSQIFNAVEMGMSTVPDHQLCLALDEARVDGRRVEAAILLGARPSIAMAAGSDFALGDFELEIAGALEGRAVEMAKCVTVDIPVPEDTEIVIEGYFSGELRDEGPFVEFTGTQTPVRKAPVFTVTAITHRKNAICQGIFAGKPPCETNAIWRELEESEAYTVLRRRYPMLIGVHRPPSLSRDFVAVLQVKNTRIRPGHVRNLLLATSAAMPRAKYLIAIDDDIDMYNLTDVMWAVATRCDPKADIVMVPGTMTARVDPSSGGLSGKLFMDATKKEGFRGTLPTFPPEARALAKSLVAEALGKK